MTLPEESETSSRKEAAQAGRGVLFIAAAKFYFMIVGAVIEFRLPVIFNNVTFGAYGFVSSLVSPINNVMVTGSIQAVSRFTSQDPERARVIQRAGLRMHAYVGLPVALIFAGLAPLLSLFFRDDDKTGPLSLAACIIAGYAFYAVFVGRANGTREFLKQAGLDMTFASLRAVGILGMAAAGFGVYGAIGGWVAAVAVILIVSMVVVGLPGSSAERQDVRPMLHFFAGVAAYLVLFNLIMVVDQLLLKRMAADWFAANRVGATSFVSEVAPSWMAQAVGPLSPADAADGQVGYYRAVQNLARLSYQAILAVTFVIFPLVSRTTFVSDREATQRYVRSTLRYSLIFAASLAVVFAANPRELLDIPYADDYASMGGPSLAVLAVGNVAFSLFAIIGTILNGAGYTRLALMTAGTTLLVAGLANALAIPRFEPGSDLLLACAVATSGAMVLGAILGGLALQRAVGAFMSLATIARVVLAGGAAVAIGWFWQLPGALGTLVESAVVGVAFLVLLAVFRELTRGDLQAVGALLNRRRKKGNA